MRLLFFCLLIRGLAAQSPDSQTVFDVATVKHGLPGDYSASVSGGPGTRDPTRYMVGNYPLSSLLGIAYGISSYQLAGPGWLDEERFTVNAKVPEGATGEQLKLMLRNLLTERFKLAAHFERREVAGYELVIARGGEKLAASRGEIKPSDDPAKAAAPLRATIDKEGYPVLPPGRQHAMIVDGDRARWRFADESMGHFAEMLESQIHLPIVNATGLTGRYDFVVSWSAAALQATAPAETGPSIFAAIQEQLGLKLEAKKVPAQVLVIDHMARTPSEN